MNKTLFGATLKEGENLRVLSSAKKFFEEFYGIQIVRYEHTRQTPTRARKHIPVDALLNCKVCGRALYESRVDVLEDSTVQVRASQHLLFYDVLGASWPTCYKLNQCYTKMGFDPEAVPHLRIHPPSFEEFFLLADSVDPQDEDARIAVEAVRSNYERVVLPFLIEWCNKDITKKNVMSFLHQFKDVQRSHLLYYEGEGAHRKVISNILNIVGVHQ